MFRLTRVLGLRGLVPGGGLRARLAAVLGVVGAGVLALAWLTHSLLLGRHARAEARAAARGATAALEALIEARVDELAGLAAEASEAGLERDQAAALASLPSVADSSVSAFVVGPNGGVTWRSAGARAELSAWIGTSPLISAQGRMKARSGAMPSPLGPLVGASAPFGPAGATFVAVRPLTTEAVDAALLGAQLVVWPAVEALVPEEARGPLRLVLERPTTLEVVDDGRFACYAALRDPDGRVALVSRAESRSAAAGIHGAWMRDTALWLVVIGIVGLVSALRFLDRAVLEPLRVLQQHAARIGRSEHGRVAIRLDRDDEFGELAQTLDGMLRTLDHARQEVVRSARFAGMSDVSKGVVHSIGNVLTSVNVSIHLIGQQLEQTGVGDLRLMIDELRQHEPDLGRYVTEDPNGKHVLSFLDAMTSSLEDLQTRSAVELEAVQKGLGHVLQLLSSIDRYASGGTFAEEFDVRSVVDMAVEVASLAHGGARDIEVVRDVAEVARVCLDKQKLTTILVHIVSNALDALAAKKGGAKRLEVAVYPSGDDRFVIEVVDNGVGIAPEHLDSLFAPGFTTKPGSTGEGLHTSANLCRELGISIGAVSDGAGTGATFKLRVPYRMPEPQAKPSEPAPILPTISGGSVQFDRRRTQRTS